MSSLRQHFPFFKHHPELIYLDSAATAQVPEEVIDAIAAYYSQSKVNIHRGAYQLADQTTSDFEQVREKVAAFIGANSSEQIVLTSGTTESLNIVANGLDDKLLEGDEIILAEASHHASIVPWVALAQRRHLTIRWVPLLNNGCSDWSQLAHLVSPRTRLIIIPHGSNVTGELVDVKTLLAELPSRVISVVDGAQAICHSAVNVTDLNCDFYAFSGHKLYGPTGVGVLYAKSHWFEQLSPLIRGGEMIQSVTKDAVSYRRGYAKFEAGTANISGVLGLGAAIDWCNRHLTPEVFEYEALLAKSCLQQLSTLSGIEVVSFHPDGIPLLLFRHRQISTQDLAIALDRYKICCRAGMHCAMPAHQALNSAGAIRVSFAAYNTDQDVSQFIACLIKAIDILSEGPPSTFQDNEHLNQVKALVNLRDWDEKYRQILRMAKALPDGAGQLRHPQHKVEGCETNVWLVCYHGNHQWHFEADADSKVIRGLLYILLAPLQYQSSSVISAFDGKAWLDELGIGRFLSASRHNGLAAVLRVIQSKVIELA